MAAYYNEFDPFAAQWLRNLIAANKIPDGIVDERSILDVKAEELEDFVQCHFFAGIAGWSVALRLSGWDDDRPVWTGSCPCGPFSAAGKNKGFDDERHLWPIFYDLIKKCRPSVVFGEQVASKGGLAWLDLVQVNLEDANYASGAVDLCAAGVGSPQIRQRLWWVGHTDRPGPQKYRKSDKDYLRQPNRSNSDRQYIDTGVSDRMAYSEHDDRWSDQSGREAKERIVDGRSCPTSRMADTDDKHKRSTNPQSQREKHPVGQGEANTFWSDAEPIYCRDEKYRLIEPGTSPLAHGVPGRVGQLRAYGNAIVPQVAQQVIETYMEYKP